MDQNMMRGENEELNAAALEETSAQELTAADSAAQEEASQQPQDGEAVPPTAESQADTCAGRSDCTSGRRGDLPCL